MVQKTNLLVFQLDRQEKYIRRENILIYEVEENKEDNDGGEKVLFKIADELEIDLKDNEIQRVHRLGQKRRNNENSRPIIARFVSYKKRNEFLTNKRELKHIEGRQHVFVCEDLTPLRYKLLKYMQESCSDTFTSCYPRNGNMKAKLKTSENGSPSLHLMISSNTELMLIINRWAVAKYKTNSTARILPSANSETKPPMQATIYTWITNSQKQNAYVSVLILYVGMLFLFWIYGCWRSSAKWASHLNRDEWTVNIAMLNCFLIVNA